MDLDDHDSFEIDFLCPQKETFYILRTTLFLFFHRSFFLSVIDSCYRHFLKISRTLRKDSKTGIVESCHADILILSRNDSIHTKQMQRKV